MAMSETTALLAIKLFDQLDVSVPGKGDLLFNIFGSGNTIVGQDRPFERFRHYETLLKILNDHDPKRYRELHKAPPTTS
jgi:hypothetical protein